MIMAQQFTEEEARALFFNRKKKTVDFEGSLPDLEMLDGQLALQELSGATVRHAKQLAKTKDGEDEILQGSAMIVKSMVLKSTGKRIFSDTDLQAVCDFGLSIINPIGAQIQALSNSKPQAIEDAKSDFLLTDSSASPSSSTAS
jgi:hypothetical protein